MNSRIYPSRCALGVRHQFIVLLLGLWFSTLATATAGDGARPIAEEDVARWNGAIAQGNLNDIVSLFTHDAMLVQPNGIAVRDNDQIRLFWKSLLETQQGPLRFELVKARRENDDTVVTRTMLSASKPLGKPGDVLHFSYKGVINDVLKRQADGSWKVQVQRWNDGSRLTEERDGPMP